MRKAWIVAASLLLMAAFVAGAGFLVRAGRFRLPAISAPGLLLLATTIAWIAWRSRKGRPWARRLEAAILAVWGSYLLFTPTLFEGWALAATRTAGLVLAGWALWLLARLVADQIRDEAN